MQKRAMSITRVIQFLKGDIWRIRQGDTSSSRWFLIRMVRIFILSLRGLIKDKCQQRATSLTYYSLLSIVPIAAMVFGIAKGFGFEKVLQERLLGLDIQPEVVTRIIEFAQALLEDTKGGLMAGIGVIILFFTIVKVLSNIETSFNDIWGVKKSRPIVRKISDYLSLMLICPLLFVSSSAITVMVSSHVRLVVNEVGMLGAVSPVIFFMLKLFPYCVIWVLFAFIYMFMPNTKVSFRSGAIAGVISGTIYQLFQFVYINFQIGVTKFNAIYGSFAALPLFLVWMQLSWLIVLLGAEISFAYQNVDTYEFEPDCLRISYSFKMLLSLMVVHLLVDLFSKGEKAWDDIRISRKLEIPIRLVRQILYELTESGIVVRVSGSDDRVVGFQPARSTNTMTIKSVVDALEAHGTDNIPVADSEELKRLSKCLKVFSDLVENSPANKPVRDI